jgi:hypothetical protein
MDGTDSWHTAAGKQHDDKEGSQHHSSLLPPRSHHVAHQQAGLAFIFIVNYFTGMYV